VPIPGEILDPEQWTRTGLKQLPDGPFDPAAVFRRRAPLVLDLGCGNGRFLLASAILRPGYDHLGVDSLPLVIRYATRRANQRGLTNVRFAVVGARELLEQHVTPSSVAEIHCYHPQPYYEAAEHSLRLITPEFLWLVRRSLASGGKFVIQTDNSAYWRYIETVVPEYFDFRTRSEPWPDAPKGRTRREIIALRRGLTVYRGVGMAAFPMAESEAKSLVSRLPQPTFDADRHRIDLDAEERLD
jgi:tRNA (guanine-N7-)-methyltransferase